MPTTTIRLREELRTDFYGEADVRFSRIEVSGRTLSWEWMRTQLERRISDLAAQPPA